MVLEMTLLDLHFYRYPPSMLAAAATHVARQMSFLGLLGGGGEGGGGGGGGDDAGRVAQQQQQQQQQQQPLWTAELEHYTHYAEATIVPCVRDLLGMLCKTEAEEVTMLGVEHSRSWCVSVKQKYQARARGRVWAARTRLRGWGVTDAGILVPPPTSDKESRRTAGGGAAGPDTCVRTAAKGWSSWIFVCWPLTCRCSTAVI
jgi:hypothetical protein